MTDKHNTTDTVNQRLKNNRHQSMRPVVPTEQTMNEPPEFCECGKVARLTWRNKKRLCKDCFIKYLKAAQ